MLVSLESLRLKRMSQSRCKELETVEQVEKKRLGALCLVETEVGTNERRI